MAGLTSLGKRRFRSPATLLTALGLVVVVQSTLAQTPTFFPNTTRAYMPRGSANFLKPYLPKPPDAGSGYRLLLETPDYLRFVTVDRSLGDPPRDVVHAPGETRNGITYVRHELVFDSYPTAAIPISALLFEATDDAPEGTGHIFTQVSGPQGPVGEIRESELVILPPLKNVRPKQVRIAPCLYDDNIQDEAVANAFAKNLWESGCTWTCCGMENRVVQMLWPKGHRAWLSKPGHPFEAIGQATSYLSEHPETGALALDGKPLAGKFCPTWLLSPDGEEPRRLMEDELVELIKKDGCTAVNWDIEQTVIGAGSSEQSARACFCLCPRCIDAFRQREKIEASETIDLKAIAGPYRDAWVAFRCQQNADLVGHMRQALKKCGRPVELSVYSGYQSQETRECYGADWALLAPHIDLAIAGYGGSRQALADTRAALGNVPLMGGQLYYLFTAPIANPQAEYEKSYMAAGSPTDLWRNYLTQQFIDGGCYGVLIWYTPTMDGGGFYRTSEVAAMIAAYENIFVNGKRCDQRVRVSGMPAQHWAAFEHENQRLLVLLNYSDKEAKVQVEQSEDQAKWQANQYGKAEPIAINPAQFEISVEPRGTMILVFTKQ
jgi:hypothetical protein